MRAHLVQFSIVWEDAAENYARVEAMLERTAIAAGDLVVLPEMFDTGFSFRLERTADGAGRTQAFVEGLARRLGVTVQGGRTVVGASGKGQNRAPIAGPTGLVGEYTKIHPFTFGREVDFFEGGSGVIVYDWVAGESRLVVCPAICYDLRFPELFRAGLSKGAEVFAYGANWPLARQEHWRALSIARAIENQAFVLGVNRTGSDPHLAYAGGSIAVDPRGKIVGELGDEEAVLSVDVDVSVLRAWRETFPAWRDGGKITSG